MTRIRFLGASALALLATASLLAACGDDDDDDDDTGTNATQPAGNPTTGGGIPSNLTTIKVADNTFTPGNLQVPVGANLIWEWSGSAPHSVVGTFDGEEIKSPQLTGTGSFQHAFQKAGTFEYECGVHGNAMSGTVRIQ